MSCEHSLSTCLCTNRRKRIFESHLLEEDNAVLGHFKLGVNGIAGGLGEGNVIYGLSCFFIGLGTSRLCILKDKQQSSD